MKHTYYFIKDDFMGQHGTDILEVDLTLKEYREAQKTGYLNGHRGFITKDYVSALYYTQD